MPFTLSSKILFSHLPSGTKSCTEDDDVANADEEENKPPRKKAKKTAQPAAKKATVNADDEGEDADGDAKGKCRLDLKQMLEDARKAVGKKTDETE